MRLGRKEANCLFIVSMIAPLVFGCDTPDRDYQATFIAQTATARKLAEGHTTETLPESTELATNSSNTTPTIESTSTTTQTPFPGHDLSEGCIYSGNWTPIHRNNDFLNEDGCWQWQDFGFVAIKGKGLFISATGNFNQPSQGLFTRPADFTKISFDLKINRMRVEQPNTTNLIFGFGKNESEMSFGLFLVIRVFANSANPVAVIASSLTNIETPQVLFTLEEGRVYPVTIELHDVYADFFIVDSKTGDVYKIEAEGLERQYHDLFYIGYRMVDGGLISVEISGLKFDPVTE